MGGRLWLLWLAVGAAGTGAYFLVPADGPARTVIYDAIGLLSAALIVVGVRLHRPARRSVWYWFAAGQALWVVGDVLYEVYPSPSVADVVYVAAYPVLAAGFAVLLRQRVRGDVAGLVDASIVATGLTLVCWVLVLRPMAADSTLPLLDKLVGLAYPAGDLLLLAILLRAVTSPGARTASFRLLVVAGALVLGADIGFSIVTLYSGYDGGVLDVGWLLSYVLWACAATHPSMRSMTDGHDAGSAERVGRGRLAVLTASSLLAPAVLFAEGALAPADIDWFAIGTGAVVLFLLVLVRMSGFVRQVQRQADQLADLAMRDDLTHLPNRRLFHERLRAALSAPAQVALVDLDEFKTINDRLGHPVGDDLLVTVGARLSALVRPVDTVARMGGDEFAIVMPGADRALADDIVDRIARDLRHPVRAGGHDLLVAASVGVVDTTGVTDPAEVIRRADVAMYAAKEIHRSWMRYRPELDERASEEARIGARLRMALARGEFHLVYQPIVALPGGEVVAVEALVRWTDGGIGPATFIPVAERTGLIVELGTWVLRTACAQAVGWLAEGPGAPGKVSVNVSARQLAEPGFADLVSDILHETGLPAHRLALEVTETAVFTGGRALDALHEVHRRGVLVALDDFGTGHSSLGLLRTVPVDILKVDKSFVDGITLGGRDAVIVRALIEVSEGLGLMAVAEGVETAEQAAALYHLGYRHAQGYHFARPRPGTELREPVQAAG
jgi:diguanylate cyclase